MDIREKCMTAGIDYDGGVERFVGQPDLFLHFLKEFVSDTTMKELEEALNEGNIKTAFETSHTLKGVVGNLSLTKLYNAIVPLVDCLRKEGNISEARLLYRDVEKEYNDIIFFIKNNIR